MRFLLLVLPALMLVSCTNNPSYETQSTQSPDSVGTVDMHGSNNSLDWDGRYTGMLPCADCDGIETIIYLSKDNTYSKRQTYLGKGVDPVEDSGEFNWSADGGSITLGADNQKYKVGENVLIALNESGKALVSGTAENYNLSKAFADKEVEDITWELMELDGAKRINKELDSKAYFILNSSEGQVSGNLGCNNFFGSYTLQSAMRISFGQLGATMKACPDMSTEQRFNEVLQTVDNYTVQNGLLYLNKAKMAPLAVFKAVNK